MCIRYQKGRMRVVVRMRVSSIQHDPCYHILDPPSHRQNKVPLKPRRYSQDIYIYAVHSGDFQIETYFQIET